MKKKIKLSDYNANINIINQKHNMSNTPEYKYWKFLREACYIPESQNYRWYGAKGYTMCNEWLNDFMSYYKWLQSMTHGERGYIKLKAGQTVYSPENCTVEIANDVISPNIDSLPGEKFGKLIVKKYSKMVKYFGKYVHYWECDCECGGHIITTEQNLLEHRVTSCGCNFNDVKDDPDFKIKCAKLHLCMVRMKDRCYNPNSDHYCYYGSKGITICDEWYYDDEKFIVWAIKNGFTPGLTIERKNINKGYSPDNCEWITHSAQATNKSNVVYYRLGSEVHHLSEWGRILGIPEKVYTKNPSHVRKVLEGRGAKEIKNPNLI